MVSRQAPLVVTQLWLPMLLLFQRAGASSPVADGWDEILTSLTAFDGPTFQDRVADPLVELSANAYRFPEVIDVAGWIPSSKVAPRAPVEGGVHALVYEEENGGPEGRVVLAFRGTQIGITRDCVADICADLILWRPPSAVCDFNLAKCSQFENATLDYFAQAVDYTRKVLSAYPSASLLFTGHSLGAGLAILVSAALSTSPGYPVIAFSSAGTKTALQVRNLNLDAEHLKRIVIIADQWDEVMRTSWDEQLGRVCMYERKMSAACKKCFDSPTCIFQTESRRQRSMLEGLLNGIFCRLCFYSTHFLASLIRTIRKGAQPACEFLV